MLCVTYIHQVPRLRDGLMEAIMDTPESDRHELLMEIECPEERARTAREWGMLDDEVNAHLYCIGNGPEAQINGAILEDRKATSLPKIGKKRPGRGKQPTRAERSAKQKLVRVGICPTCGRG
jgi:hypothetical protein